MVNQGARKSLGSSLNRIKSSISNSFKKSANFPKSISTFNLNLNSRTFGRSASFTDHKRLFTARENNVGSGFSDSASPLFDDFGANGSSEFAGAGVHQPGSYSADMGHSTRDFYTTRSNDLYSARPSANHSTSVAENPVSKYDNDLWKEYSRYLNNDEFDRIYKDYLERNGKEFLSVGLRTYIEAVIDTKRFRNRCFYVLSKNSTSKYLSNYYSRVRQADASNRSSSTPELYYGYGAAYNNESSSHSSDNYRTVRYDPPRSRLNYSNDSNTHSDAFNSKFTPEKVSFPGPNKTGSATNPPFSSNNVESDDKIDDFVSNYEYLSSWKRYSGASAAYTPRATNGILVTDNPPLNPASTTATNILAASPLPDKALHIAFFDEVLSHNEKLKLLEKIGIADDYIAKRICSKFSDRNAINNLVFCTEKRSLEDFNLFHKENLKHQLDLNQELSQELLLISNLNTPNPLNRHKDKDDGDASATDLFKNPASDKFSESSSLFRRISDTIDRNKDTSPIHLLNLTFS